MSVRANIIWYAVPRVLSRASALLLLPVYTRVLSPDEMGVAMVVLALAGMSGLIIAPGIEGVYLRWACQEKGGEACVTSGMGTIAWLHLAMLIIGLGALAACSDLVGAMLLPGVPQWPFYYAMLATVGCASLSAPLRASWRAAHRADKVARIEFAHLTIAIITILTALVVLRWGPVSLLLGELAAGLILAPWYVGKMVTYLREGWDQGAYRALAPLAFIGLPLTVSGYVLSGFDRVLLHRIAGPAEVGWYAAGYQLGIAVMAIVITLNKEWQPLIFRLAGKPAQGSERLQQLWTNSLVLVVAAGSCISLFSVEIVRLWLGDRYAASTAVIPPMVLVAMLRTPRYFLTNLSLAVARGRDLTVDSVLAMAVFAGANLALIPIFGAVGAAWAGVITYAGSCVFLYTRRWNAFRLSRRVLGWGVVAVIATGLSMVMGGTRATEVVGMVACVLIVHQAIRYWAFLGTMHPVEVQS